MGERHAVLGAAVENLGCRVNRVESDRMVRDLIGAGFSIVEPDEAFVVVVNTCAVTGEAEAKTRKAVRRAAARALRPYVIATGCAANLHADALAELSERVVVEPLKTEVAARALALADEAGLVPQGSAADDAVLPHEPLDVARALGRCRLGVKVQDGCDNRCTYCIVWKARGASRSVPADEVVAEVRRAEREGVPEVVLTGVNLGRYEDASRTGADGGVLGLAGLLARVLDETGIAHVRLSSIEPPEVTDELIQAVASSKGRVAPFFHMPLQSGCTATLARMGRLYTADEYRDVCARIRAALPAAALSCDLIVGFPGESDEEFAESLAFCHEMGFARMHVFRYSPRPGTPAAARADQVDPAVKARRSAQMRAATEEMARADRLRRVGSSELAVVEAPAAGTLSSFHHVEIDGEAPAPGTLARVTLDYVDAAGVLHGRVAAQD